MRFAAFLSLGLGANVAIASVCKPRSRDSSSVSTETASASSKESVAVSTTSTDIVTATTTIELSISVTSTEDDKTSTQATESQSASVELSASTATETTTTEIPTTTAETTTTAEATTTTEDTFVPIPTFNIKAVGSGVDGQLLRGDPVAYSNIGWFTPMFAPPPPVLTLSIDANTNYVREINTGKYMCVSYGGGGFPNSNMLCDPSNPMSGIVPVTCEQTRDRKLKCSAPAGECHLDEMSDTTYCNTVPGTWDKFNVITGRIINTPALVMVSSSDPSTPSDMKAVELQLVPYAD
ncbi:hypothetical protein FNAPI_7499 [Fusarium napiforme]|uniref:Uncharacterized protein n=1 Tax=Fusarium napiforme TaxID=42672 RepID=A0A8H5J9A5_9HYPO|nr:hypothetical protein FNAPI_7499 [Fusarium napiforme]